MQELCAYVKLRDDCATDSESNLMSTLFYFPAIIKSFLTSNVLLSGVLYISGLTKQNYEIENQHILRSWHPYKPI